MLVFVSHIPIISLKKTLIYQLGSYAVDCYYVQFVWFLKHTLVVYALAKNNPKNLYVHLKKDSHLGQYMCEYHFCVEYPFTF